MDSAKKVIVGDSSTPQSLPFFSTELSPEAQDAIFEEFNTLSVVYQQPAALFVQSAQYQAEDEAEEVQVGYINPGLPAPVVMVSCLASICQVIIGRGAHALQTPLPKSQSTNEHLWQQQSRAHPSALLCAKDGVSESCVAAADGAAVASDPPLSAPRLAPLMLCQQRVCWWMSRPTCSARSSSRKQTCWTWGMMTRAHPPRQQVGNEAAFHAGRFVPLLMPVAIMPSGGCHAACCTCRCFKQVGLVELASCSEWIAASCSHSNYLHAVWYMSCNHGSQVQHP